MTMDMNVVARLKRRIDDARSLGFKIRMEPLDGEQATWCEIGGVPTLFVDLSQTAAEQLQQLDEALTAYCQRGNESRTVGLSGADRTSTGARETSPNERAA